MRIMAGLGLILPLVSSFAHAADAERPVIETGKDPFGKPSPIEVYMRPAIVLDLDKLSIAQRRVLWARYREAAAPIAPTRVECNVGAPGVNRSIGCEFAGQDYDETIAKVLSVFRLMDMLGVSPPRIAAISESEARRRDRVIRYDVSVVGTPLSEPAPAPDGEMVDKAEILGLDAVRSKIDYPAGARRNAATGTLQARCTVEADLSVTCNQKSFAPPENAIFFREAAQDLMLSGRVGPTLANGQSSVGARFMIAVAFNLPPAGR